MTGKDEPVRNSKDEARNKVVKKRDAARKKVETMKNYWDVSGAVHGSGPLMKKEKK